MFETERKGTYKYWFKYWYGVTAIKLRTWTELRSMLADKFACKKDSYSYSLSTVYRRELVCNKKMNEGEELRIALNLMAVTSYQKKKQYPLTVKFLGKSKNFSF